MVCTYEIKQWDHIGVPVKKQYKMYMNILKESPQTFFAKRDVVCETAFVTNCNLYLHSFK